MSSLLLIGAIGAMFIGSLQNEDFLFTLLFCFILTCIGQLLKNHQRISSLEASEKIKFLFSHTLIFVPLLSIIWGIGQIF